MKEPKRSVRDYTKFNAVSGPRNKTNYALILGMILEDVYTLRKKPMKSDRICIHHERPRKSLCGKPGLEIVRKEVSFGYLLRLWRQYIQNDFSLGDYKQYERKIIADWIRSAKRT